ncbi:MAG: hypothetical protein AAF265_08165 [Pseudomonadota bacterium]
MAPDLPSTNLRSTQQPIKDDLPDAPVIDNHLASDKAIKTAPRYRVDSRLLETVQWRSEVPEEYLSQPTRSITDTVNMARSGVAYAQFEIALIKSMCWDVAHDESTLEANIEQYLQTRIVGKPDFSSAGYTDAQYVAIRIGGMRQSFEQCTEFRAAIGDQINDDLAQQAVDNGSAAAMWFLTIDYIERDPDYAYELAETAWGLGKWAALDPLSNLAQQRYIDGVYPSGDVESAALFLLYVELYELSDTHRIEKYGGHRSFTHGYHSVVERKIDALLPHQRPQVIERANELLELNTRCCLD